MCHLNELAVSAVSGASSLGGYTFSDMVSIGLLFGYVGWVSGAPFLAGVGIGAGYVGFMMAAGSLDHYLDLKEQPSEFGRLEKKELEQPSALALA